MAKSEPNASGIQLMPMELKEKPTPFKKKVALGSLYMQACLKLYMNICPSMK
jgi:hypothetical protein